VSDILTSPTILESLRKTTKALSQDSRSLCRISNPGPSNTKQNYQLLTRLWHLVSHSEKWSLIYQVIKLLGRTASTVHGVYTKTYRHVEADINLDIERWWVFSFTFRPLYSGTHSLMAGWEGWGELNLHPAVLKRTFPVFAGIKT
jgi:hypothetical protein